MERTEEQLNSNVEEKQSPELKDNETNDEKKDNEESKPETNSNESAPTNGRIDWANEIENKQDPTATTDSEYEDIDDDEDENQETKQTSDAEPKDQSDKQESTADDESNTKSTNNENGKPKKESKNVKKDPSVIPRKSYFFEHDDREEDRNEPRRQTQRGRPNWNNNKSSVRSHRGNPDERWTHDRFNLNEQKPKTKTEIVKRYGYDIRQDTQSQPETPEKPTTELKKPTTADGTNAPDRAGRKSNVRKKQPSGPNRLSNRANNTSTNNEYEEVDDDYQDEAERNELAKSLRQPDNNQPDNDQMGRKLANLRRKPATANKSLNESFNSEFKNNQLPKDKMNNNIFDDYKLTHNNNNQNYSNKKQQTFNNNQRSNRNFGQNYANKARYVDRMNQMPNERYEQRDMGHNHKQELNQQHQPQGPKHGQNNYNTNEMPKRYSSMRNQQQIQKTSNEQQTPTVLNEQYQMKNYNNFSDQQQQPTQQYPIQQFVYQNNRQHQPSMPMHQQTTNYHHQRHQNHNWQMANNHQYGHLISPTVQQPTNGQQYYYLPQNDYMMTVAPISNPVYYPNNSNNASQQFTNQPATLQQQPTKQSRAIPIVNPQKQN